MSNPDGGDNPVADDDLVECVADDCDTRLSLRDLVENGSIDEGWLEYVTQETQLDSAGTYLRQSGKARCDDHVETIEDAAREWCDGFESAIGVELPQSARRSIVELATLLHERESDAERF